MGQSVADRLDRAVGSDLSTERLAHRVFAAIAPAVPFDFACLAPTDPATGLITWAYKSRPLDSGDEEFAAVEYGPPDINSFSSLADRHPPVGALGLDTDGHPERCRRHRELMWPQFAFTDELRLVCRHRGVSWAALALYRGVDEPAFTAAEVDQLGRAGEVIGRAVSRSLFLAPAGPGQDQSPGSGPAVLIVDAADQVTQLTPSADTAIDELGGWDHGCLPAGVLAVVSTTRRQGTHTQTYVRAAQGRWLSLRAAALSGPGDGVNGDGTVVVTVDMTPPAMLSRLALAAHGLTAREEDVALLVLQGASTEAISRSLYLSPHTVQDHLKKIFAKLGVTSRRDMTARLTML